MTVEARDSVFVAAAFNARAAHPFGALRGSARLRAWPAPPGGPAPGPSAGSRTSAADARPALSRTARAEGTKRAEPRGPPRGVLRRDGAGPSPDVRGRPPRRSPAESPPKSKPTKGTGMPTASAASEPRSLPAVTLRFAALCACCLLGQASLNGRPRKRMSRGARDIPEATAGFPNKGPLPSHRTAQLMRSALRACCARPLTAVLRGYCGRKSRSAVQGIGLFRIIPETKPLVLQTTMLPTRTLRERRGSCAAHFVQSLFRGSDGAQAVLPAAQ